MDFLSHFRVLIDYPAQKLYLSPIEHDAKALYPTEAARTCAERLVDDAVFEPDANGKWALASFAHFTGHFASIGLKIGDVLVSIGGEKVDGLLPDELTQLLRKHHEEQALCFLRDSKPLSL